MEGARKDFQSIDAKATAKSNNMANMEGAQMDYQGNPMNTKDTTSPLDHEMKKADKDLDNILKEVEEDLKVISGERAITIEEPNEALGRSHIATVSHSIQAFNQIEILQKECEAKDKRLAADAALIKEQKAEIAKKDAEIREGEKTRKNVERLYTSAIMDKSKLSEKIEKLEKESAAKEPKFAADAALIEELRAQIARKDIMTEQCDLVTILVHQHRIVFEAKERLEKEMKAKDGEINYLKHQNERAAWELTQAHLNLKRETTYKDSFIRNLSRQVERLNHEAEQLRGRVNDQEMTPLHIIAGYENQLEELNFQARLPSQTDSSLLYIRQEQYAMSMKIVEEQRRMLNRAEAKNKANTNLASRT